MMKKILFVCTGNTCRSPMAEALFNKMLKDKGIADITAGSAGLNAFDGDRASENAIEAVKEKGCDLTRHRARKVSSQILEGCSAVYTMSPGHKSMLEAAFPAIKGKVFILGVGISDPYGGDLETYRHCRDQIENALNVILKELLNDAAD